MECTSWENICHSESNFHNSRGRGGSISLPNLLIELCNKWEVSTGQIREVACCEFGSDSCLVFASQGPEFSLFLNRCLLYLAQVSVNDFVIRAVALALAEVPAANALWDAASEAPAAASGVDIAIAVATDAGLITPIVKAADTKTLLAISAEVKELAARARANKLKPEEFQVGRYPSYQASIPQPLLHELLFLVEFGSFVIHWLGAAQWELVYLTFLPLPSSCDRGPDLT